MLTAVGQTTNQDAQSTVISHLFTATLTRFQPVITTISSTASRLALTVTDLKRSLMQAEVCSTFLSVMKLTLSPPTNVTLTHIMFLSATVLTEQLPGLQTQLEKLTTLVHFQELTTLVNGQAATTTPEFMMNPGLMTLLIFLKITAPTEQHTQNLIQNGTIQTSPVSRSKRVLSALSLLIHPIIVQEMTASMFMMPALNSLHHRVSICTVSAKMTLMRNQTSIKTLSTSLLMTVMPGHRKIKSFTAESIPMLLTLGTDTPVTFSKV